MVEHVVLKGEFLRALASANRLLIRPGVRFDSAYKFTCEWIDYKQRANIKIVKTVKCECSYVKVYIKICGYSGSGCDRF